MTEILFHPKFKKDIKSFPKELIIAIKQAIDLISQNPTLQEKLKGELNEIYKYKIYFQKTQYRLAYALEENKIVFLMAGKRESFYQALKRRLS